jgi:hypothetical protein
VGGASRTAERDSIDRERLEGALRELIACRQMLDRVMKDN